MEMEYFSINFKHKHKHTRTRPSKCIIVVSEVRIRITEFHYFFIFDTGENGEKIMDPINFLRRVSFVVTDSLHKAARPAAGRKLFVNNMIFRGLEKTRI